MFSKRFLTVVFSAAAIFIGFPVVSHAELVASGKLAVYAGKDCGGEPLAHAIEIEETKLDDNRIRQFLVIPNKPGALSSLPIHEKQENTKDRRCASGIAESTYRIGDGDGALPLETVVVCKATRDTRDSQSLRDSGFVTAIDENGKERIGLCVRKEF